VGQFPGQEVNQVMEYFFHGLIGAIFSKPIKINNIFSEVP
jgi:hypothetical protein